MNKRILNSILIATLLASCIGCTTQQNGNNGKQDTTTENKDSYNMYYGDYQDMTSQRASATLQESENGKSISILVSWASSSQEVTQWNMNATLKDGKLEYTDCVRMEINGDESKADVVYDNGTGYFEIDENGNLKWTGASDQECQGCVFEKVE